MQRISRPPLIMVGNKKWMWIIVNAILLQISAHPSVIKSINHTHYGNDKRKLALPSLAAPAFKRSLIFIDLLASGEYLFGWINTLKKQQHCFIARRWPDRTRASRWVVYWSIVRVFQHVSCLYLIVKKLKVAASRGGEQTLPQASSLRPSPGSCGPHSQLPLRTLSYIWTRAVN